jgi:hypothetical protein
LSHTETRAPPPPGSRSLTSIISKSRLRQSQVFSIATAPPPIPSRTARRPPSPSLS